MPLKPSAKPARRLSALPVIALLSGLSIALVLIALQGFGQVFGLLLEGGLQLLWVPPAWLPSLLPAVLGWRLLFPPGRAPRWSRTLVALWMGRSVNNLLPVAQLGGELVKARLAAHWGSTTPEALASVVADKTCQALALMAWGMLGGGLLALLTLERRLAWLALGGSLLLGFGILGFILVQRAGMFRLLGTLADKLGSTLGNSRGADGLARHGTAVDQALRATYTRRWRFAAAALARLLHLVLQTFELWLACRLLGFPLGLPEAALLRSLSAAASDILFVVPAGYGVQEGALLALGLLVGLTPPQALALSLCLRLKDLCVDLPGVLCWQHWEARQLRRATAGPAPEAAPRAPPPESDPGA